jgi:hypothetical protein
MVRIVFSLLQRVHEFHFIFVKFRAVLIAMLASTIPVSILGIQFAMGVSPFWTPAQFSQYRYPFPRSLSPRDHSQRTDDSTRVIACVWRHIVPVVGMLCGNAISGVLVLLSFILKELE